MLFFGYALLQILVVIALMFFAYPPFSSFMVPLMIKVFGEPAVHYPNNFMVLPSMYFWINLIFSGFLGTIIIGGATNLFSLKYSDKPVVLSKGIAKVWPGYATLLLVWVIETAVLLGLFEVFPPLLNKIAFFSNYGPLMKQMVITIVALVVGSLFVYTTALVLLERRGAFSAIAQSFKLFGKYPVATVLLMVVPNFVKLPIDMLASKTDFLIRKFNPETIAFSIILGVLVSVFTNFVLIGTVTRYFMFTREV